MDDRITHIEASEAAAQFSSLLRDVERGMEFAIMDHGEQIARLSPMARADKEKAKTLIARSREIAQHCTLDGLSWKELRDAGRKW